MGRAIILINIMFLLVSCASINIGESSNIEHTNSNYFYYKGYVFANEHLNMNSERKSSNKDYYFRYNGKNYYIKHSNSKDYESIVAVDGKFVKLKGEIQHGFLDSYRTKEQSRIGDYIVFTELIETRRPIKIVVIDGNNNSYILKPYKIYYDPISIFESSSGIYYGGSPKENYISHVEFMDVFFKIEDLTKIGFKKSDNRNKGDFSISIYYLEDDSENFVIEDSLEIIALKDYIDSLIRD